MKRLCRRSSLLLPIILTLLGGLFLSPKVQASDPWQQASLENQSGQDLFDYLRKNGGIPSKKKRGEKHFEVISKIVFDFGTPFDEFLGRPDTIEGEVRFGLALLEALATEEELISYEEMTRANFMLNELAGRLLGNAIRDLHLFRMLEAELHFMFGRIRDERLQQKDELMAQLVWVTFHHIRNAGERQVHMSDIVWKHILPYEASSKELTSSLGQIGRIGWGDLDSDNAMNRVVRFQRRLWTHGVVDRALEELPSDFLSESGATRPRQVELTYRNVAPKALRTLRDLRGIRELATHSTVATELQKIKGLEPTRLKYIIHPFPVIK